MKGIELKALSEIGRQAVEKHFKDKKKEKLKDRMLYRQTFKEEILQDEYGIYGFRLWARHRYFAPESMRPIAEDMMAENGAKETDYLLTIIEE